MKRKIFMLSSAIFLAVSFSGAVCTGKEEAMKIKSSVFEHNQYLPKKYTCHGEGVNPPLDIEGIPSGAKSLALIVDDPDAPRGTYVHWVVFDIPLPGRIGENSVPGKLGTNTSGATDYVSPCPPSGVHRYFYKVYALDTLLNLSDSGITKGQLEKAMAAHILDKAEIVGLVEGR